MMANLSSHAFAPLLGKQVKINTKGPEATLGILLYVAKDHLMLQTEKEVIYYNLDHVKSATVDQDYVPETSGEKSFNPIKKRSIREVLAALRHKWITINRGGPEHLEGILVSTENDHILLVKQNELVCITLSHIKSFSTIETKIKEATEEAKS